MFVASKKKKSNEFLEIEYIFSLEKPHKNSENKIQKQ